MSLFKTVLASVGIGSAKVDTRLDKAVAIPGESLAGEVQVTGGGLTQEIDRIYLYVATKYKREQNDSEYYEECRLMKYQVSEGFTIQPEATRVIPFRITIPHQTPLTLGRQEVFIRTGLDIAMAINPRDWDAISIEPHPLMQIVLDALERLGFRLYKSDCEYNVRLGRDYPFVQELEFRPSSNYQRYFDELEVIFYLQPDRLEVLLIIDRRARGIMSLIDEALDMDDRFDRLYITETDLERPLQNLVSKIEGILQQHIG